MKNYSIKPHIYNLGMLKRDIETKKMQMKSDQIDVKFNSYSSVIDSKIKESKKSKSYNSTIIALFYTDYNPRAHKKVKKNQIFTNNETGDKYAQISAGTYTIGSDYKHLERKENKGRYYDTEEDYKAFNGLLELMGNNSKDFATFYGNAQSAITAIIIPKVDVREIDTNPRNPSQVI